MIWFFYNSLFAVVFVLLTPHFLWRMRRRGGYRSDFLQRFGCYSKAFLAKTGTHQRSWLHAVSVGEVFVALEFMKEVRRQYPGSAFILSVTTSTGHKIAKEKLTDRDLLIYFPVDAPFIMRKVLRILKPTRIILVECEIWPNLIRLATARGVPVSLINGRMSDSSFSGYRKLSFFTRRILPLIQPIVMQGERDRERMLALGSTPETTLALGSAKFDVAPAGAMDDATARAVLEQAGLGEGRTILLGGSTWPGEEDVLLDIYQRLRQSFPELALVLVPRHFERAGEILSMLAAKGQGVVQRSLMSLGEPGEQTWRRDHQVAQQDRITDSARSVPAPPGTDHVLLVDSTGELMQFYQVADVVFVGKSLCQTGGQNPLEPAALGKPTLVGPHMENFPSVMDLLVKEDALIQVADASDLEARIAALLKDPDARSALGARASGCVAAHRGVLGRTVGLVFGGGA